MADIIPKWVETLIIGIVLIAALFGLMWFLSNFSNPEAAQNFTKSILK